MMRRVLAECAHHRPLNRADNSLLGATLTRVVAHGGLLKLATLLLTIAMPNPNSNLPALTWVNWFA